MSKCLIHVQVFPNPLISDTDISTEIKQIHKLFETALTDPNGGLVVTRAGVEVNVVYLDNDTPTTVADKCRPGDGLTTDAIEFL